MEVNLIDSNPTMSSEEIRMITSCVMRNGDAKLQIIEAERLLNAVTRAQQGVPTGVNNTQEK